MDVDGPWVRVVVEGPSDLAAAEKLLGSRGVRADPVRSIIAGGKTRLDPRLKSYNAAAHHGGWFVLRDADQDGDDCPVVVRQTLLAPASQAPSMCFRLAVRSLEAWLMADAEALTSHFALVRSRVPARPEEERDPKQAFVNACRSSRRSDVRAAVVPPTGSARSVGPEYVAFVSDYCRLAWRPDVAAASAPSLRRALAEIDRLIGSGVWA